MTTLELTLNLPERLAEQAQAAGLLTPQAIEQMLKRELKRRAGEHLLTSGQALQTAKPAVTESDVQSEISSARQERRAGRS